MNKYDLLFKEPMRPQHTPHYSSEARHTAKVFVVCNQQDTAPIWGYILRQGGLLVILETCVEKAIERWSSELPDLVVIDVAGGPAERMDLYQRFRAVSVAPILLLLPAYHETDLLAAYHAGVDDVVVKPVSPPIFLAKIMAWVRRSWTVPVSSLNIVNAGGYRLDPSRRCLFMSEGTEVKLTNLEFHLLHLLMSQPGQVFTIEDIVQAIWGGYGKGDQILLKNVVYRLRKKIEADSAHPLLLQTGQGGYLFRGQG